MEPTSGMSIPTTTESLPQSSAPTTAQIPRIGIFSRFTKQARNASVDPCVSPFTAAKSVLPFPQYTETVSCISSATRTADTVTPATTAAAASISSDEVDVAKLKAENDQLRKRCDELTVQSKLNQDMLQECISSSKIDIDNVKVDNDKLRSRYDELAMQSKLNQDMLEQCVTSSKTDFDNLSNENEKLAGRCEELTVQSQLKQSVIQHFTDDLVAKDTEIKNLGEQVKELQSITPDLNPQNIENKTLQATIQHLQLSLLDQEENYRRLQAMGCGRLPPSNEADLLRRIETLEFDNSLLQERIDKHKSDTKALVLDYADELNDLSEQLRIAETDAQCYSKQVTLQENTFRTLHAEYDTLVEELNFERTANRDLEKQILSAHSKDKSSGSGQEPRGLELQNDVLATKLAKAQASATEREKLLDKFKTQQQQLIASIAQDREDQARQTQRIATLYSENQNDRKRFEGKLRSRDKRIQGLERKLRGMEKGARDSTGSVLDDGVSRVDSVVNKSEHTEEDAGG